jgi:glycosyltransferase involved in cell wall biosynthesis
MVSVIIPTCNRARLIHRSLNSVLNQTFEDYEIIIIDDCSDDNTEATIDKYIDKNIKYFRHKVRKGGAAARNTGLGIAEGRFVAFLDDDDEWLPEKLKFQVEVLDNKPELGMVYTGYFYIDDIKKRTLKIFRPAKKGFIYNDLLKTNCVGTTSTPLIRKECFDKVGVFDEALPACQDWDMWIRISKAFEIDYLKQPLVNFFIHNDRITRNVKAKIEGRKILLKKFYDDIKESKQNLSIHYFTIGYLLCHNDKVSDGRKKIFKSIKLYPFNIIYYKYFFLSLFGSSIYKKLLNFKARLGNILA